jgi:Carboxypeptidase regulatory-like domain/TonB-dependent Receptor Plug Domain
MKLFKTMLFFVLTVVLVSSFATTTAAQSSITGAISGAITDPSGAAVPGATITLASKGTGEVLTATSDNSGAYTIPIIKPGEYILTVEKQSFRKVEKPVTVVVGQNLTNSFKLEVGNVSETVSVEAAPPLLQAENANLATTIEARQVENLPNGGNDMSAIALTAPGVLANTSSGGGYGNFTAYGLPATANLFTINGNDSNDPYLNLNNSGATNLMLGTNEVQEVAVISNAYTVQYGRQAGAQVDYATKSGSNQFHGNAAYNYNSGGMNANDFFNNATSTPLPKEINNQWAASFGGPIKKDKAFFFIDHEGLRYILGTSNQEILPTPAFQQAVISNMQAGNSAVTAASVPFYQNMFNLMNGAPGLNRAKPVDNTIDGTGNLGCGDLNTSGGSGIAGNGGIVPGFAQFGGTGANSTYGTNLGGGQPCAQWYRSTVGALSPEWILAGKVDVNFNDANHASIRYRMDRGTQATYTDPISPVFNATSSQPEYEGQINWNHVFSPAKTNQLIISGLWYSAIFGPEATKAQSTFNGALYNFDSSGWGSNSTFSLLGGENNVFPQGRNVSQAQVVDDFSWTKGNHALKFGGNFRYNKISDHSNSVRVNPRLRIFSTTDFAEGEILQISQRWPALTSTSAGIYSLGLYAMDEWRVNANLKLTLGLRVDRNSNATCYQNCFSRLYTTFPNVNHDPAIPFNQLYQNNLSHAFPDLQPIVWEPRVGFAWTPNTKFTKPGSTVIRGGVGLFSDLYPAGLIDSYMHNAMALRQFTISTNPALSTAEPGNAYQSESVCNGIFSGVVNGGGTRADYLAQAAAAGLPCAVPDYNSVGNKVYNPMFIEWNLQVQQSLGSKTVLSFNYVGNHGYNMFTNNPWANSSAPVPNANCPGSPQSLENTCTPFVGLPALRPDLRVNNVFNLTNDGYSNYNGLSVSFTQRVTKGFSGTINYAYSHTADLVSNGGVTEPFSLNDSINGIVNPTCLSCNYSNSDYDVRHFISANYIWQLPFKFSNKFLETVAGGWQISETFAWRTGLPFSVTDGLIPGTGGSIRNSVNGVFLASPSGAPLTLNCTSAAGNTYSANPQPCLSASQFLPFKGETSFSVLRRNSFRGPGYFNSDFSVLKNFQLNERFRFSLGANFYNVFNHPNFGNPNGDITSGQFGQILNTDIPPTSPYGAFVGSAVSGREIQITSRITF